VLNLVAWAVASAAHATEPGGNRPATAGFTEGCTRLAGGDLMLVLTPACTAQLATEAGKQAFQDLVHSEVGKLERKNASNAGRSARTNLSRLSELSAMDGNPAARRAANYATRQATPLGGAHAGSTIQPSR